MKTAELINQGSVQTVRLPEGMRIDGSEVLVKRVGKSLLLIPKDSNRWQMLVNSLDEFTTDYMADRKQPPSQPREAVFE